MIIIVIQAQNMQPAGEQEIKASYWKQVKQQQEDWLIIQKQVAPLRGPNPREFSRIPKPESKNKNKETWRQRRPQMDAEL